MLLFLDELAKKQTIGLVVHSLITISAALDSHGLRIPFTFVRRRVPALLSILYKTNRYVAVSDVSYNLEIN